MKGSFDGVEARRFFWLGPSRTRMLRIISEMEDVDKRLVFVWECLSPDMRRELALGVAATVDYDQQQQRRYFANTALLKRHVHIAERLLVLLFRVQKFSSSTPEPLPCVFYNWIIPQGMDRHTHDRTNWLFRFLNASLVDGGAADARPLVFGLLCCLMREKSHYVEQHWLQSCSEEVALSIWFAPADQTYGTKRDPYAAGDGTTAAKASEWFNLCPVLLQHLSNRYQNVCLATWPTMEQRDKSDLFIRVDTLEFGARLLRESGTHFEMPKDKPFEKCLTRWLTLWTFHCMGALNNTTTTVINIHELVKRTHIVGNAIKK